jgi:hypothetical protein
MTTENLGRLEQLKDLRSVWQTEAGSFTPWLAGEENLSLLGDTVGIDLELEATEKDVGPFRADILCKDTATGHWVLVENQLERTDHTHLGQLMTYAAGLKAVTIIWIADRFAEEHRAAVDWLNEITSDRFSFFGLEIELWRIGDSQIAPKFNIVAKPNEWTKGRIVPPPDGELSETRQMQREYWQGLCGELTNNPCDVRPTKPPPQSWMNFSIGRSDFALVAAMNTRKKYLYVSLVCGGDDAKSHYGLLAEEQEAIDAEAGFPLSWEELPRKKSSYISTYLRDAEPTDRSQWKSQHEWLRDRLGLFRRIFSARVRALDASDYQPDEPETDA